MMQEMAFYKQEVALYKEQMVKQACQGLSLDQMIVRALENDKKSCKLVLPEEKHIINKEDYYIVKMKRNGIGEERTNSSL